MGTLVERAGRAVWTRLGQVALRGRDSTATTGGGWGASCTHVLSAWSPKAISS